MGFTCIYSGCVMCDGCMRCQPDELDFVDELEDEEEEDGLVQRQTLL